MRNTAADMCVHVAAAVVVNQSEEVLIARRPAEAHQGGLWEFPGGKLEAGETVEQTCFVDVVVWGRQAETASEYLHKGSPVFVEGRLQLDQWENQQGEKRSKLRVRADRVQFLGSPGKGTEYAAAPADSAPPPAAPAPEVADEDDVPF